MSAEWFDALNESTRQVNRMIYSLLPGDDCVNLYKASRHLVDAGGKRLRPFLVLTCCELVGGDSTKAVPAAAAVELLHNFTLVHDDIMDRDQLRRNVPTVHSLYGVATAIMAGDTLFAKSYEAALSSEGISSKKLLSVLKAITKATVEICEGQALDMSFEGRCKVTEKEYLTMVKKKTAALLVASSQIGAIIGGGATGVINRLGRAFTAAGLAFQMVDDILGLIADEKTLGKPMGSDIRDGKSTLITIHGLKNSRGMDRQTILEALGNENATLSEIREAVEVLKTLGSVGYVAFKAEMLTCKAKAELTKFPPSAARERLLAVMDYIVRRER